MLISRWTSNVHVEAAKKLQICYDDFLELVHATTLDDLTRRTQTFVEMLGFDCFIFGGFFAVDNEFANPLTLGTYPEAWLCRYRERGYHLLDPCVHHVLKSAFPAPWQLSWFESATATALLKEAHAFGLASGAVSPQHGPIGSFGFGVASARDLESALPDICVRLPQVHMLASCFFQAFQSLYRVVPKPVELTAREQQCLMFAANGCRDGEIAEKLGISANTVIFHLNNARAKLQAKNRSQMIARGIALGVVVL